MEVWKRLAVLTLIALLGGFVLCSCDTGTFVEPTPVLTIPGSVEGFVRDSDTPLNDAVPRARVFTSPSDRVTFTDATGYYRIDGLQPGSYQITAVTTDPTVPFRSASTDTVIVGGLTSLASIDFAAPLPSNLAQIVFLSDRELLGSPYAFLSNWRGDTPVRFMPELAVAISSIRWNPSDREEVLYTTPGAGGEVYRYDTRTRTSQAVTANGVEEMGADFSPDGTRVVVATDTDADGNYEIRLMNRDGSGAITLVDDYNGATGQTFDNRWPSWAPDGYSIAFSSRRTDLGAPVDQVDYEVCTTPVIGGPILQLTRDMVDDVDLSWHPSSRQLVWAKRYNLHYQLYTQPAAEGATASRLTDGAYDNRSPSFSWDAERIVWTSNANFDGRNPDGNVEVWSAVYEGSYLVTPTDITWQLPPVTHASVRFRPR